MFQSDVVSFQINILSSSFYLLCCTYTQFYDSFFSLCFLAQSNTLKFIAYFRCNGVKWNHLLTLDTLLCGTAFLMITHENWIPSVWEKNKKKKSNKFGTFFVFMVIKFFFKYYLIHSTCNINTRLKLTKLRCINTASKTIKRTAVSSMLFLTPIQDEKKRVCRFQKNILFIKWHKCNGSFRR